MKNPPELSAFWEALDQESEPPEVPGPLKTGNLNSNLSLGDRLAQRWANGFLPLFIFILATMIGVGARGQLPVLLGAPLLGIILAWLLAPFIVDRRGLSWWRLVLLVIPLLSFYVPFVMALPLETAESFSRRRRYSGPELVTNLQNNLESIGHHSTMMFLLVTLGCLLLVSHFLRKTYPWIDPERTNRYRKTGSLLLAFFPFLGLAGLLWMSRLSPEVDSWAQETKSQMSERQLAIHSNSLSRKTWAKFSESYSYKGRDSVRRELAPALLRQLQDYPPENLLEFNRADRLLDDSLTTRRGVIPRSQEQELALELLRIRVQARPAYQYIPTERIFNDWIVDDLVSPETGKDELKAIHSKLESIESQLPKDYATELDINAFQFFFWSDNRTAVTSFHGDRHTVYRLRNSSPLKFLGKEWSPSPTELYAAYLRRESAESWLELRKRLKRLEPREARQLLNELQDQRDERTEYPKLSHDFLNEIPGRTYVDFLTPWFEVSSLILELRQTKFDKGSYPQALPEAWTTRHPGRWQWARVQGEWTLTDTKLLKYEKGRPAHSWRLP